MLGQFYLSIVEESLKEYFADVLKEVRLEKGLTQQKLCDLANMERVVLSRIERKISFPSIPTLFRLCVVLGIKPSEIVKKVESRQNSA